MLTIKEVAEFLKVKPVTIYKLVNENVLPGMKVAGSWRFKKDTIDEWIDSDAANKKMGIFADEMKDTKAS